MPIEAQNGLHLLFCKSWLYIFEFNYTTSLIFYLIYVTMKLTIYIDYRFG